MKRPKVIMHNSISVDGSFTGSGTKLELLACKNMSQGLVLLRYRVL